MTYFWGVTLVFARRNVVKIDPRAYFDILHNIIMLFSTLVEIFCNEVQFRTRAENMQNMP